MAFVTFEKPNFENLSALIESKSNDKQWRNALKQYKGILGKGNMARVTHTPDSYGRYTSVARNGTKKTAHTGAKFPRHIRAALFGSRYDDLDIVNASGSIMFQLFNNLGYMCHYMGRYAEHRERVLREIMDNYETPLDRDTAKEMVIEVFFGGDGNVALSNQISIPRKGRNRLPTFIEGLKKEYTEFIKELMDSCEDQTSEDWVDNPYLDVHYWSQQKCESKGMPNWIGTFASCLYQSEERKVLDTIISEVNAIAEENHVKDPIGSLIHDGLLAAKELNIEAYLRRIEERIERDTGYELKLAVKPMNQADMSSEDQEKSYETLKDEFEKTRFKTREDSNHQFHTVYPETGKVVACNKTDFSVMHEDWVEDGHKFLVQWFADPNKRSYKYIDYSCVSKGDQKPDVYYAFPELRFKQLATITYAEERQRHIDFLNDYLRLVVEDNDSFVKWITLWLADILVNPHTKGGQPVAVVLCANQGSGKTSLRELMTKILGEVMVHNTANPAGNSDVLHPDFNGALKYKLFIEFEEINMKTHSKVVDGIKALVTDNVHMIKHKGHEPVSVKASERYLFTTNSPGSIIVEQGDRRYCTLSMSNRRVGDAAYWKEFYELINNDAFIMNVAEYLCSFADELVGYEFGTNKPLTRYYEQLKDLSFPPELEFLRDTYFDSEEGEEITISSSQLSRMFNSWRESHSMEGKTSDRMFSMRLKTHGDKYGISSKKTKTNNVFVIDTDKLREQISKDLGLN